MPYFILTLTELLGIDDYEQNFHIRSWVVQLTCSMQQCFGLFSFSKRYVFPRNIVSSSWQFIHKISLLFAETILVELLWKLFPNFLSFVHFICSSLVLYVEMATSLPSPGVNISLRFNTPFQDGFVVVILITHCRVEFAPASKQNKPLSPICIRLHYVHEGIFSAVHYFFLTCRLH